MRQVSPMTMTRREIERRLQAMEARLGSYAKPQKAQIPAWLVEDLRGQGVRFHADGCIDWQSANWNAGWRGKDA